MSYAALEAQDYLKVPYRHKEVNPHEDVIGQKLFQNYVVEYWGKSPKQLRLFKNVQVKEMDNTPTTKDFDYVFTSIHGVACFNINLAKETIEIEVKQMEMDIEASSRVFKFYDRSEF